MGNSEILKCKYCSSSSTIKYGKTSKGTLRYKCKDCGKTWVNDSDKNAGKPPIYELVEQYLGGKSFRELVPFYKSSPLRINQKIREFLEETPHWEGYLDKVIGRHQPQIIYMMGESFSCQVKGENLNSKYLALAIDGISSMVIGYEIGDSNSKELWEKLIKRLKTRGIMTTTFFSSGALPIVNNVKKYYPDAVHRINFAKSYRNKEISCCLFKLPSKTKLILDVINMYNSLENKNLKDYLENQIGINFQKYISRNQGEFLEYLENRFDLTIVRIENLTEEFKKRFDKFHMVKHDPWPLVNGWIAYNMLCNFNGENYNRLWLYGFLPKESNFELYSKNEKPDISYLKSEELKPFILELGYRILQLPMRVSHCELDIEQCAEI